MVVNQDILPASIKARAAEYMKSGLDVKDSLRKACDDEIEFAGRIVQQMNRSWRNPDVEDLIQAMAKDVYERIRSDEAKRQREQFREHLESVSRVVASWPKWKREVLGGVGR